MYEVIATENHELQCQCYSFNKAQDIATALNQVSKNQFAVRRNDEIVWSTRDGWNY